ncbi:hypothetical protein AVEN_219073-1 [Araneus ventricosus]|uniref:Endonuclease/exonuclease/phosphatase domain-containing protein n=1 Tax=Araneus ventricosus TaxID=182803 RepID=A0A4Y2GE80_ARAVE|nr:hypothetical protein AVEN_219073-1 [Araneus ventricosus]
MPSHTTRDPAGVAMLATQIATTRIEDGAQPTEQINQLTNTTARFTKERWLNTRGESITPKPLQQPFLNSFSAFSTIIFMNPLENSQFFSRCTISHSKRALRILQINLHKCEPAMRQLRQVVPQHKIDIILAQEPYIKKTRSRAYHKSGRAGPLRMEKLPSSSLAPLKPPLSPHSTTSLQ